MRKSLALAIALLIAPLLLHGSVVAQGVGPYPGVPFPPVVHTQDLTETYVYCEPSPQPSLVSGPALVYGQTVTVQYVANHRSLQQLPSGQTVLSVNGKATVYAGADTSGAVLDVRPFKNVVVASEWPFSWYGCLQQLHYRFAIGDVYEVAGDGRDGWWMFWYTVYTEPPVSLGYGYGFPCQTSP